MGDQSPMAEGMGFSDQPQFTGRSIVLFKAEAGDEPASSKRMENVLYERAGLQNIANMLDFNPNKSSNEAYLSDENTAMVMPELGIAVIPADEDVVMNLSASGDTSDEIEAVIPERFDYLLDANGEGDGLQTLPVEPLRQGMQLEDPIIEPAAIKKMARWMKLLERLYEEAARSVPEEEEAAFEPTGFSDTSQATWGLIATRVLTSRYSGRGVKVAIIDTGLDVNHRDFRGRRIVTRVFAPPGTMPQPTNPHGTHVAGTACGPKLPASGLRYGVAFESEILALKVFNDATRPGARRGDVLAAMDFAHRSGARILNLSLGSATNGTVDPEYDRAITNFRRRNTLTIAAAGNEGRQRFRTGSPANSPAAIAVAAVDQNLRKADFSNFGPPMDIAAPGVDIISSVPGGGTLRFNGTSMAAPHVAGITALLLQQDPRRSADQLETILRRSARPLAQSASLVGAGLVQAPQ